MSLIVPPYGPLDASIVFIGEAPGMNEVRVGRPFVGDAGKQLRNDCISQKISLSECYLTNVVKERPIDNDIKRFINLQNKYPKTTEKYDEYEEKLYDELVSLQGVKVLVPLGNVPLYAITRKRKITNWRGSVLEQSIRGRTFKVVPTLHPASLLPGRGKYVMRYPVRHDLGRIKYNSTFSGIRRDTRRLTLEPTYRVAKDYLQDVKLGEKVYFDIEIYNQEVSCISFQSPNGRAICIPFITEGRNYFSVQEEVSIWREISEILGNKKIMKVAQNSAFDADFLFMKYGIVTEPLGDTLVAHSILYPELPISL